MPFQLFIDLVSQEVFMRKNMRKNMIAMIGSFITAISAISFTSIEKNASNDQMIQPVIAQQFYEQAKKNNYWKTAFATGKHEQIVFMNISPLTNPNNEIGVETHPFDQIILIVEGDGKAILHGKESPVKAGDMIFIPQGIPHNVINLDPEKALKLISFYSDTDIPTGSVYKRKVDESAG